MLSDLVIRQIIVFRLRNYQLIVAWWKFDVLKTNVSQNNGLKVPSADDTIPASHDQFKPIRVGENLMVNCMYKKVKCVKYLHFIQYLTGYLCHD